VDFTNITNQDVSVISPNPDEYRKILSKIEREEKETNILSLKILEHLKTIKLPYSAKRRLLLSAISLCNSALVEEEDKLYYGDTVDKEII